MMRRSIPVLALGGALEIGSPVHSAASPAPPAVVVTWFSHLHPTVGQQETL